MWWSGGDLSTSSFSINGIGAFDLLRRHARMQELRRTPGTAATLLFVRLFFWVPVPVRLDCRRRHGTSHSPGRGGRAGRPSHVRPQCIAHIRLNAGKTRVWNAGGLAVELASRWSHEARTQPSTVRRPRPPFSLHSCPCRPLVRPACLCCGSRPHTSSLLASRLAVQQTMSLPATARPPPCPSAAFPPALEHGGLVAFCAKLGTGTARTARKKVRFKEISKKVGSSLLQVCAADVCLSQSLQRKDECLSHASRHICRVGMGVPNSAARSTASRRDYTVAGCSRYDGKS